MLATGVASTNSSHSHTLASGLQNMFNYMTGTGMGMMLITGDNTPEARSSPLTRYLGRDISTIMNGVIKRKLKIIPKDLV